MNTLYFKTKRDINGNTYYLAVDLAGRTVAKGYHVVFAAPEAPVITRKKMEEIYSAFVRAGYSKKEE